MYIDPYLLAYMLVGAFIAWRMAISYTAIVVLVLLWPLFVLLMGVGLFFNAWQEHKWKQGKL